MTDIAPTSLARLAFWSTNMAMIKDSGMSWPGFSYSDSEWRRMGELADIVSGSDFVRFIAINTVIFIALAALGVGAILLPILNALYPDPSQLQPLPFTLLLAATALAIIGFGLPLSMRVAAALSVNAAMRAKLVPRGGDAALASKVSFQFLRMTVIMCGILIPGMLLFIAYDIDGGPVVAILKWIAAAMMAASIAHTALRSR